MDVLSLFFAAEVAVDIVLKATLVLGTAWALTCLLRRASAATRHAVWATAMISLLLMPLFSLSLPSWSVGLLPPADAASVWLQKGMAEHIVSAREANPVLPAEHADPMPAVAAVSVEEQVADLGSSPTLTMEASAEDASPPGGWSFITWFIVVWGLGAASVLARLGLHLLRVWILTRRAHPLDDAALQTMATQLAGQLGLRRRVQIRLSPSVAMPMTWAIRQPVVLLPQEATSWPPARFRVVLLHELAHVRRLDYLAHLTTQAVSALYWFNPLVWIAAQRLQVEQERACDDMVLRTGTGSFDYAEHLLDIARSFYKDRVRWQGGIAMARQSTLKERIQAILSPHSNRHGLTLRTGVAVALLLAGLAVPLAALRPWSQEGEWEKERKSDAVEVFIEALDDPDAQARQRAAWALGDRESPKAVDALVEHLRDEDPGVRTMAAWALGEIKDPRAVGPLLETLGMGDAYEQEMRIMALGEVEDERALDALVRLLEEEDATLRAAAAWALGEIRSPRSVAHLAEVVLWDEDVRTRRKAVEALEKQGDPAAVPALLKALQDSDVGLRRDAIQALVNLQDGRAIAPLSNTLRHDAVADVRMMAAAALGMFQEAEAIEGLVYGLHDGHAAVREQSAWALGVVGDAGAVDALLAALHDPDPNVRSRVVWALDEVSLP